jgi:hypothetical protein
VLVSVAVEVTAEIITEERVSVTVLKETVGDTMTVVAVEVTVAVDVEVRETVAVVVTG